MSEPPKKSSSKQQSIPRVPKTRRSTGKSIGNGADDQDPIVKEAMFVGIDPGVKGGIVGIYWKGAQRYVEQWKMPTTRGAVIKLFKTMTDKFDCYAVIEGVHAMPGNSGRSMFTFGQGLGVLLTCMDVYRWNYSVEDPRVWQKFVGIRAKGKDETKSAWKNRLVRYANQMVQVSTNPYTADASLMAIRSIAFWKNGLVIKSVND